MGQIRNADGTFGSSDGKKNSGKKPARTDIRKQDVDRAINMFFTEQQPLPKKLPKQRIRANVDAFVDVNLPGEVIVTGGLSDAIMKLCIALLAIVLAGYTLWYIGAHP